MSPLLEFRGWTQGCHSNSSTSYPLGTKNVYHSLKLIKCKTAYEIFKAYEDINLIKTKETNPYGHEVLFPVELQWTIEIAIWFECHSSELFH